VLSLNFSSLGASRGRSGDARAHYLDNNRDNDETDDNEPKPYRFLAEWGTGHESGTLLHVANSGLTHGDDWLRHGNYGLTIGTRLRHGNRMTRGERSGTMALAGRHGDVWLCDSSRLPACQR
jgi:hypothetical protein